MAFAKKLQMQLEFSSIVVARNQKHCSKEIRFSQEVFVSAKSSEIASHLQPCPQNACRYAHISDQVAYSVWLKIPNVYIYFILQAKDVKFTTVISLIKTFVTVKLMPN